MSGLSETATCLDQFFNVLHHPDQVILYLLPPQATVARSLEVVSGGLPKRPFHFPASSQPVAMRLQTSALGITGIDQFLIVMTHEGSACLGTGAASS